jgi:hypothetical protein
MRIDALEDGVRVPTHCLYPGGDSVAVKVALAESGLRVSDDGLAWATLLAAGLDPSPSQIRSAYAVASETGLAFEHGAFVADEVAEDQLSAAILVVANASQRWVVGVLGDVGRRADRDLKRRVRESVRRIFSTAKIDGDKEIVGESTKKYVIAEVIQSAKGTLLIDPVTNHQNAIASAFLKFTDIGRAKPEWPRVAVVENLPSWKAEDVNVLSEASTSVIDIEVGLEPIRQKYAA